MERVRTAASSCVVGGMAALVAGAFLPWARSGARERTSFELAAVVDRVGVAPGGPVGAAVRLWPAVPLLAAVAVAAALTGHRMVAAAVGAACGLTALVLGVAVHSSPLEPLPGTTVASLAAALALGAGAVLAAEGLVRRRKGDQLR